MALKVGIPLYEGFDSLDVIGPFQTFTFAEMERHLIGSGNASGPIAVTSFEGIRVTPDKTFESCPQLDVIFVPGGSDPVSVLTAGHPGKNPYLDFLIRQSKGAQLMCSVCTGALLLAGAGLLDGHIVTTHWAFKDVLRLFPVHVVDDYRRYVQSGQRITGAGISSGLDESLYIVSLLYGVDTARRCQLAMQYNPHPPFRCGDPGDSEIQDDPRMVEDRKAQWHISDAAKVVESWLRGAKKTV
jgi:transcriptional regulator GlxA family with amidase domain